VAHRGFAINADGSRALVVRDRVGVPELVLLDVATGTEIIATPLLNKSTFPAVSVGSGRIVSVTPSRDAVVVTQKYTIKVALPDLYWTQVLEFATLALRRELAVSYDPQWMAISPNGERAFVASHDRRGDVAALQVLDLRTGQRTIDMAVAQAAALGVAFVPQAPTLQPAEVTGQQVTIAWSFAAHSPAAQRFLVHVGSRSGATDLGTLDVGDDTSLSVSGVPPGRYFVRVTATNVTGTSSPSTEVVIDAPAPTGGQ
jgi:hypothetical protein